MYPHSSECLTYHIVKVTFHDSNKHCKPSTKAPVASYSNSWQAPTSEKAIQVNPPVLILSNPQTLKLKTPPTSIAQNYS
ncbi:predicted protein [Botrytis cinerea T4]|uniref:Uncharacterized protein n=1 Tax=Botryotinia fuckeliana (strain T4) TaxID=999810 RepID=G2Y3M5_BOTF4|nr:predicted protein [Botrytis cinerea T4]